MAWGRGAAGAAAAGADRSLSGSADGGVLTPSFYARPTEIVARDLLGRVLVSVVEGERVAGRIVETGAYLGPHDPACHAAERIGRTRRNESMFAVPGTAYVYKIYGIHWCLNAVTERRDFPAAVLIRALEPIAGREVMRVRRGTRDRELASGPGRLCQALGIDGELDGHGLDSPPLLVEAGEPLPEDRVATTPRIGISRAADWPLRFVEKGSGWASR